MNCPRRWPRHTSHSSKSKSSPAEPTELFLCGKGRLNDLRAANEGPVRLVNKMEMRDGKNGRRFNQGRLLAHEAVQLPSIGKNKARRIG